MSAPRIETVPQFIRELESIAYSAGRYPNTVFRDWLNMIVCAHAMQTQEEEYLKTVKPYADKDKGLPVRLSHLYGALVMAMEKERRDILGEIFMEAVSRGEAGQFFTPESICKLMAQMSGVPTTGSPSVADPACGSGRCLLAVAEINPKSILVGTDVDVTCVQMFAVNVALNGLQGFAVHGNTLTNEVWKVYKIGMPGFPGVIYPVSYSYLTDYLDRNRDRDDKATPKANGQSGEMLRSAEGIPVRSVPAKKSARRAAEIASQLDESSTEKCDECSTMLIEVQLKRQPKSGLA